jgi:hypothetical protein
VTLRVPSDPAAVYLHPLSLRQSLPSTAIPLRRDDPEVRLNLQELIDAAYLNGRYGRRIDYSKAPQPPLSAEDQQWADALLPQAGRR